MNLPEALRAKTFGMPRWVWLLLISGGVVVGLYLRARAAEAQQQTEDTGATDATLTDSTDTLEGAADPGLAGVGTFGPSGGSVVPVASPTIPEGFPDVFAGLGDTLSSLAGSLADVAAGQQGGGNGGGGTGGGVPPTPAGTPPPPATPPAAPTQHVINLPNPPTSVAMARAQIASLRIRLAAATDPKVRAALMAAIAQRQHYIETHTGGGASTPAHAGNLSSAGASYAPRPTGGGAPPVPPTAHRPIAVAPPKPRPKLGTGGAHYG